MTAVAIIGIAVFANVSLSGQTSQNLAYDTNLLVATELSTAVMEDLMNRNSTDAVLTAGEHTQDYDLNQLPVASGLFTVTWVVTLDTPMVSMMQIDETVNVRSQNGRHPITVTTFRGEN